MMMIKGQDRSVIYIRSLYKKFRNEEAEKQPLYSPVDESRISVTKPFKESTK